MDEEAASDANHSKMRDAAVEQRPIESVAALSLTVEQRGSQFTRISDVDDEILTLLIQERTQLGKRLYWLIFCPFLITRLAKWSGVTDDNARLVISVAGVALLVSVVAIAPRILTKRSAIDAGLSPQLASRTAKAIERHAGWALGKSVPRIDLIRRDILQLEKAGSPRGAERKP